MSWLERASLATISHDGPARDLWSSAAVRESCSPNALLDDWVSRHADAPIPDQRKAVEAVLDIQSAAIGRTDLDEAEPVQLPTDDRLEVLRQIGTSAATAALELLPEAERTPSERMFYALLQGEHVDLEVQDRQQLAALRKATEWAAAAGASVGVDLAEVDLKLNDIDFLQTLGGPDLHRFVGRQALLQRLHRTWNHTQDSAARVVIEGPGGVGKSLLVARFASDLLHAEPKRPAIAVFHIDFDSLALQRARPSTLLHEIVRQALQLWSRGPEENVRSLRDLERTLSYGQSELESEAFRSTEAMGSGDETSVVVSTLLSTLSAKRLLLIYDNCEQVAGFDEETEYSVQVVEELLRRETNLMTIYVGRAFPPDSWITEATTLRLTVGRFSNAEAETYLQNEAARSGLQAPVAILRAVRHQVGPSPLALRLAVRLLETEPNFDLSNWPHAAGRSGERIQALLYDRILLRIRDPEVRKLARPGLLLRRLNEEIVEQVLAEPCRLDLSAGGAELLHRARREGQLFVEKDTDPGALYHRPDVRALMLPELDRSLEDEIRQTINERAVHYYASHGRGTIERAEELYHRFRLEEPLEEIAERWTDEAGQLLKPVLSELPQAGRRYVRARLGTTSARRGTDKEDSVSQPVTPIDAAAALKLPPRSRAEDRVPGYVGATERPPLSTPPASTRAAGGVRLLSHPLLVASAAIAGVTAVTFLITFFVRSSNAIPVWWFYAVLSVVTVLATAVTIQQLVRLRTEDRRSEVVEVRARELRGVARRRFQSGRDADELQADLEQEGQEQLDGPLGDIAAELLVARGQQDRLIKLARALPRQWSAPADVKSAMLATVAAVFEGRGMLRDADTFWQRSAQVLPTDSDPLRRLAALVGNIRVRRKLQRAARPDLELALMLVALHEDEITRRRVLARETAAELAQVLLEADNEHVEPVRRLVMFVIEVGEAFPSAVGRPKRIREIGLALGLDLSERFSSLHELSSVIGKLVYTRDKTVLAKLVSVLREEVDKVLRRTATSAGKAR